MSSGELQRLHDELTVKTRELEIWRALDRLRDAHRDPAVLLANIATELATQFNANWCGLFVCHQERKTLELKAFRESGLSFAALTPAQIDALAQTAARNGEVRVYTQDGLKQLLGADILPANSQLAAVPVALFGELLGLLLLVRCADPFSAEDVRMLRTAERQIDSAILQCRATQELQLRNRELETIYRIDHIRDKRLPFEEMLNEVVNELQQVIRSELCFIELYERGTQRLNVQSAVADGDLLDLSEHQRIGTQTAREALERGEMICREYDAGRVHSVLCQPLILMNEIIGVLGLVNRQGIGRFSDDDRHLMHAVASQMDTAIFENTERIHLRQVLGRAMDPRVLSRILEQRGSELLKGERATISILYADIRGSTSLAEVATPEMLVGFINDYLSSMTKVVFRHDGVVDKFIGDEIMALFGTPFPQPDHALRAVRVALEFQATQQQVMQRWKANGLDAGPIGVGIATGEVIVGDIGSPERSEYTAIGRAANLGARICSVAKGNEILISPATYEMVRSAVEVTPVCGLSFKGVGDNETVYRIERLL